MWEIVGKREEGEEGGGGEDERRRVSEGVWDER